MNDKTPTLPRTANPADRAAIAAILADTQDDPMCNKAVRVAHEVLRQVSGAAFEAQPFMLTGLARFGDQEYAACSCFYHTVLILEDWAFVFSRDEGGMVPWHTKNNFTLPQMEYFDCRVEIEPGTRGALLSYVREQLVQHQAGAAEAELETEVGSTPGEIF